MNLKFLIYFYLLFITSCNNKVSSDLSVRDVQLLIKKDTLYKKLIPKIQKVQDSISKDIILNAKFYDLTYQQCFNYEKRKNEAFILFIEKCKKEIKEDLNKVKILQSLVDISFKKIERVEDSKFNYLLTFNISFKDSTENIFLIYSIYEEFGSIKLKILEDTTTIKSSEIIKELKIPINISRDFEYYFIDIFYYDFINRDLPVSYFNSKYTFQFNVYPLSNKRRYLWLYNINCHSFDFLKDETYISIILAEYREKWIDLCKSIDLLPFEYFSDDANFEIFENYIRDMYE